MTLKDKYIITIEEDDTILDDKFFLLIALSRAFNRAYKRAKLSEYSDQDVILAQNILDSLEDNDNLKTLILNTNISTIICVLSSDVMYYLPADAVLYLRGNLHVVLPYSFEIVAVKKFISGLPKSAL